MYEHQDHIFERGSYEKLKAARKYPGESFNQVILRASWPEETITGAELLRRIRQGGAHFIDEELNRIEQLKKREKAPKDKWKTR